MTTPLRELTTLRLGGPPARLVEATETDGLVAALRDEPGPLLIVAGGSNLVVADEGFPGTVVLVRTRGITEDGDELEVAAGEGWDELVARCVVEGRGGVECLSGIPGSVGATPIQNVGAYGQEVAETIAAVQVLDRGSGEVAWWRPQDCAFGYRRSTFKRHPDAYVVLAVRFRLPRTGSSGPIRYGELARALGVEPGATAPPAEVREAVLGLRRGKGMVLDPSDPDTRSAGSFFTNPFVDADRLPDGAPAWPQDDGRVKTSAAWLIEYAGFERGYGDAAGIAISSKHTLALTNRGAGTAAQLVELAREIADGVEERFGVVLENEPVLVGLRLR